MRASFSTGQILEIAKISRRTLERWHALNLFVPAGGKSPGKGRNRQYSFGDLITALVLSCLRAAQFPLELSTALVEHTSSLTQDDHTSGFVVLSVHGDFMPLEGSDLAAHFAQDDSKVAVVLHLGSIHEEAVAAAVEWTFEKRPRRGPKPGQAAKKLSKRREENKALRQGTKDKLPPSVTQKRKNNAGKYNAALPTSVGQNSAASVSTRGTGKAPRARGQTDSVGKYKARAVKPAHGSSIRSHGVRRKRAQRRLKSRLRRAHRRRGRSATARARPSTSEEPYPLERSSGERLQFLGAHHHWTPQHLAHGLSKTQSAPRNKSLGRPSSTAQSTSSAPAQGALR